ncbi:MAG TPA: non-homologous end-joining DNA ligase [Kofleriaceae bacterium]|nr:non-homologous end-joining DNA ligase [Kofleriaceae bacterium]
MAEAKQMLEVEGREIGLTHTEKVLFPEASLTKGDLIAYYRRIAPVMLPHLAGRPLSLQRYPDGITAAGFMQKNASDYFPDWVERASLAKQDGEVQHVIARDAATLVYLANQAAITLHVGLSRVDRIDQPDRLVIDFDPSDDDFAKVKRAAKRARQLLEAVGLVPFVQTTGSRGLHVWVPLERKEGFDEVRAFAGEIAARLVAQSPDELTTEQRKAARGDRVYVDVARNAYAQTAAAPYTVRARPTAPVATPLEWDELGDRALTPDRYTIGNLFRRLGQRPDPWREMARHAQPLEAARARLAEQG